MDEQKVAKIRLNLTKEWHQEIQDQKPFRDWQNSPLLSIVNLVRANGGEVVLLTVPISSVAREAQETPIRKRDRPFFKEFLSDEHLKLLSPDVPTSDADFPDLVHLNLAKREPFSRDLFDICAREGVFQTLRPSGAPGSTPQPEGRP